MTGRPHQRLVLSCLLTVTTLAVVMVGDPHPHAAARQQPSTPPPIATAPAPLAARIDRDALRREVTALAAPAFAGRRAGAEGGIAARRFLIERFKTIGLAPTGESFEQPFSFTEPPRGREAAPSPEPIRAANVVGMITGTAGANAKTIVISAHYDHLGVRDGVVYPGADDNASGVAVLLAIATHLRKVPPKHNVVFAAFDAEELGLQGAKAFVAKPPVPLASIALDVNLDMVSRNDRNEIYASGLSHYPQFAAVVDEVQRRTPVKILRGHDQPPAVAGGPDDWTLQSDHGEFHKAGVPYLYFGVEDHPDYHRPGDTADKIDIGFFGNVADMILDTVLTLDQRLP